MRMWCAAAALVLLGMQAGQAVAQDAPRAKARTETQATRMGTHPDLTRLVLDVSEISKFYTHVADEGRRVLVGIPSVDWETNRHRLKPHGIISRFDFMRRGMKRGLLVVYTHAPARIEYQFTLPPDPADHKGNRLVIDLVPRDHAGKVPIPKRIEPKSERKPTAKAAPAATPKPAVPVGQAKPAAPLPKPAVPAGEPAYSSFPASIQ